MSYRVVINNIYMEQQLKAKISAGLFLLAISMFFLFSFSYNSWFYFCLIAG